MVSGMQRAGRLLGFVIFTGALLRAVSVSSTAADHGQAVQLTKRVFPLDIKFGEGKAVVKRGPHNAPELQNFARLLKQYPFVHVEIEGNPDPARPQAFNRDLSVRRAEALRDTFIELYGIPPGRIQTHAAGETNAATESKTVAAPPKDRPVFVILYRLEPPAP